MTDAKLLWLDLEMSGLEVELCRILEVAAIVTDFSFKELGQFDCIVKQPPAVLEAMDDWCKRTHGESGLTAAVAKGISEPEAEAKFLQFINAHFTKDDRAVLAGNSIGQDRKFIDFYWKQAASRLHYRMLDVTSFKILFTNRYDVKYEKKGRHRALDDIRESIAELSFYAGHVQLSPPSPQPPA